MRTCLSWSGALVAALLCGSPAPASPPGDDIVDGDRPVTGLAGRYTSSIGELEVEQPDPNTLKLHYEAVWGPSAHICECDATADFQDGAWFTDDDLRVLADGETITLAGQPGCCGANWPGDSFARSAQADPGPTLGPADTPAGTHCTGGEVAVFSCPVKGDKVLSVCRTAELTMRSGGMWYRFGKPGKVELTFPDGDQHPSETFTQRNEIVGPRSNSWNLIFVNDRHEFTVFYDFFHGEESAGVRVKLPDDKGVVEIPCTESPTVTSVPDPLVPEAS